MTDVAWQREVRETRASWQHRRKRRAQARVLASKGNAWSITARLYMAGSTRLLGDIGDAEADALVGQLDDLWRRMDAPELARLEAALRRRP